MTTSFAKNLLIAVSIFFLSSCAIGDEKPSKVDQPLVEDKYKLTKDREAFEEIQKEVPPEKKVENDELAFIMQWMGEVKRPPSEVREKFNSAITKKRQLFHKDMEKQRTEYVKKERKDREAFLKEHEKQRKNFVSNKPSNEDKREFFNEHDTKRRDFLTTQRENRDEFEADMRDKRKNFDDYVRERTSEFYQEHRAYTKRYEDYQKQLKEQKKSQGASQ